VVGDFVGSAACKECHSKEFQSHHASHHALTMRSADRAGLGSLAPPSGRIEHTRYALAHQGARLQFTLEESTGKAQTVQLALGSGKTGMTYIVIPDNHSVSEMPMSYFPALKRWMPTPGDDFGGGDEVGQTRTGSLARKCLLCHAVAVNERTGMPEPKFFGVGCESCHGPSSAHVAAMRSSDMSDLHMEHLGSWSATRLNEMCGRCHGTAQSILPNSLSSLKTHRLQPYGLMESRCFQESNDTLSCLTCHDPHTDVSLDTAAYERKCLGCHAPDAAPAERTHSATGKACPVNPHTGCIPCHMPMREAFPGMDMPTRMADHLIRVNKSE